MRKGANNSYFGNIVEATRTLWAGLKLSLKHYNNADKSRKEQDITADNYFDQDKGLTTLKYPHEMIPVPDNGRYRLHNEMEDCIVCDKCAKICPVDCIEIEPIRSPESFGETSDGTPKRIHAAKFDIDMSKCCFCGLCTTVCPTECLTMTKSFDYSEFDVKEHTYEFGILSADEAKTKEKEWEEFEAAKEATKVQSTQAGVKPMVKPKTMGKPVMKPKMVKPVISSKRVVSKPIINPKDKKEDNIDPEIGQEGGEA